MDRASYGGITEHSFRSKGVDTTAMLDSDSLPPLELCVELWASYLCKGEKGA